jgi:RNA polymerase sigma factor (sigma-70 family)
MLNNPPVAPLLENAARGVESAWRELVKRYSPLLIAVCHRYRISDADAQDVAASVWLRLVTSLPSIRDPDALPGWLQTTARRECLMLLRHSTRQIPTDDALIESTTDPDFDANLIGEERRAAARAAVAQLPARDRTLLSMLFSDPPTPYREISSTLGIPIGAIGPTRARCLTRARRTPAVVALVDEPTRAHSQRSDQIAG